MKRTLLCLLAAVAGLAAQPVVNPQKAGMDPQRLALIAPRMKEFEEKGQVPGTVTLLQRHGAIAHFEATGFADVDAKKPMRTNTIFQIMSMTKPFTGVCIMMLADEGKLRINDPVERYIPEFHGQKLTTGQAPARPITIRDLMMHTSGMMGNPPPSTGPQMRKMDMPLAQAVALYGKEPLRFEPGTRWSYSTVGVDTLGRIVEVVSGMKYEDFLAKRIFEPLGMVDSYIFLPASKHARLADVYTMKDGKMARGGANLIGGDPYAFRPGAVYPGPGFAMYSTALDLSKFYEMMLRKGVYQGKRLLSAVSVENMSMVQTGDLQAGHDPGDGFGLTWEVTKDPIGMLYGLSKGAFHHGGAFGTFGYIDPPKDMVGVYMTQWDGPDEKLPREAFIQIGVASIQE